MYSQSVEPMLERMLPLESAFVCRTLRTTAVGESRVQERIGVPLEPLVARGLELGYCARPGEVDVRLAAFGPQADALVSEGAGIVRSQLEAHIFGEADDDLETILVRLLTSRKATLSLAESCTGGGISNRLTNVPGASAVLLAGLVTYSNESKQKFLGVRADTLAAHGAVSEPVAREMAEGARSQTGSDYGLSVTGIAGPGGGTPDKPVGTVFIGLAGFEKTLIKCNFNPYDRETFKQVTAQQALELLRQSLLKQAP
jgi:nicotinamide-nucleotide amidase